MKKVIHSSLLTNILLLIICLLPLKSFADCGELSIECIHPELVKPIQEALIKQKNFSGAKNFDWFKNKSISSVLYDFLHKKGVYDKYYNPKLDKNFNPKVPLYFGSYDAKCGRRLGDEINTNCFIGALDSHIINELWGLDFDYESADEEQRIEFLKKIGVQLQ